MPEILSPEKLDAGARILNHEYHRMENHSIAEDWAACDYFSRQSCRASADFMDAFLCMAGTDRGTVSREGWPDDSEVLENLSAAEHERWCAFHYANGYRSMPREVFDERGEAYSEEIREKGCSGIRIGKDTKNRLHACLVPWEELDELSEREARYTKIRKDYRKMDLDNVLMIPGILKQAERSRKNQKE